MELEYLREIISKSEIGINVKSIENPDSGTVGNTYLLNAESGKYVLKVFAKKETGHLRKTIKALNKINEENKMSICPINSELLNFGGDVGIIYPFFEGEPFEDIYIKNWPFVFGQVVGEFNKRSKELFLEELTKERHNSLKESVKNSINSLRETAEFLDFKSKDNDKEITKLLRNASSLLENEEISDEIRISWVHGDLNFENVLYNKEDDSYRIIDVFNMNFDFLIKDISVALSHSIRENCEETRDIIKDLLDGYESKIRLNKKERVFVPFFALLHKAGEVAWLINKYYGAEISKKVSDKYLPIDSSTLGLMIEQYEDIKNVLSRPKQ